MNEITNLEIITFIVLFIAAILAVGKYDSRKKRRY